jgi:hypothetical protein
MAVKNGLLCLTQFVCSSASNLPVQFAHSLGNAGGIKPHTPLCTKFWVPCSRLRGTGDAEAAASKRSGNRGRLEFENDEPKPPSEATIYGNDGEKLQ